MRIYFLMFPLFQAFCRFIGFCILLCLWNNDWVFRSYILTLFSTCVYNIMQDFLWNSSNAVHNFFNGRVYWEVTCLCRVVVCFLSLFTLLHLFGILCHLCVSLLVVDLCLLGFRVFVCRAFRKITLVYFRSTMVYP